jgi:biopolymer transport protein ExbD
MAMSVNDGGYSSRSRRRRGGSGTLSEINVTPFVDVVLVLLIIFMLTAHVMDYGIEVSVPQVKYVQGSTEDRPVVTIDKTGDYTFRGCGDSGGHVNINNLVAEIHSKCASAKGVYVQADKETIWDPIAQVTAELGHGNLVVYMVTQPVDAATKRR